ncbi:growth hormone secretagogue receptor type 1-like [Ciona intestinalis]
MGNCTLNVTISNPNGVTSEVSNIVITFFISLFMLIGLAGNILTMVTIGTSKSLHSVSNLVIFSLCVSDLTSAVVCSPLWLYRRTWGFETWEMGSFMCKFYWISDFATSYVTSLHIVSFAALRYVAVKRPFCVTSISKRRVSAAIVLFWVISLAVALPLAVYMGVRVRREQEDIGMSWPSCSIIDDGDCCVAMYNLYISIVNPIFFYLPMGILFTLSLLIITVLSERNRWRRAASNFLDCEHYSRHLDTINQSQPPLPDVIAQTTDPDNVLDDETRNASNLHTTPAPQIRTVACPTHRVARQNVSDARYYRERKIFIQLILIVINFVIGYIPVTAYLMWTTVTPKCSKSIPYATDYWFGVASYLCLRISECMNPVMYNLGSTNMRKESLRVLKRAFCCKS